MKILDDLYPAYITRVPYLIIYFFLQCGATKVVDNNISFSDRTFGNFFESV